MSESKKQLRSRADKKSARQLAASPYGLAVSVALTRDQAEILDDEKADLLKSIHHLGSLSAAASHLSISYRHAWNLVAEMNGSSNCKIVEKTTGGASGGGASLTTEGATLLAYYEASNREIQTCAASIAQKHAQVISRQKSRVRVLAAVSLQDFLSHSVAQFSLGNPSIKISAVYGASNQLVDMIAEGSPFDLVITVGRRELARISKRQIIDNASITTIAANNLAVIGPKSLQLSKKQLLKEICSKRRTVFMAHPNVPLGKLTQRWLQNEGVATGQNNRFIYVEDSASVMTNAHVQQDALGFVYASQAFQAVKLGTCYIERDACYQIEYCLAKAADQVFHEPVDSLMTFLQSPEAQRIGKSAGLLYPST